LLTEQTKHLINKNNVDRIKKGALIINTARGPIIETEALVYGLQNGIIAGAGLDVLEDEGQTKDEIHALATKLPPEELKTILENHMLMKMPNVLVTPHNAFNSNEALERILNTTAENIKAFMAGKPTNRVE
jgi:D-lactate dehydrogenase